jgi:hypothetical protein
MDYRQAVIFGIVVPVGGNNQQDKKIKIEGDPNDIDIE